MLKSQVLTKTRRMYAEGHQVASHTWSHPDLCNITSAQRKNEMIKNEMAIRNIIGVIPTYMRPPYSSCTAECGCEADLQALGYHITYFDLDTADYLNDSPTLIQNSKNIFDAALSGKSPTTDDFLVISHDIHNQTSQVSTFFCIMREKRTKGEDLGGGGGKICADERTGIGRVHAPEYNIEGI